MTPETIAVVVTVSILGGVLVIALLVVCIVKVVSDNKYKKSQRKQFGNGYMTELEESHEHPSYVHYPEPEPYTPTHPPEADPWRASHVEASGYSQESSYDTQDHGMPNSDLYRHPSIHQPYAGPPNGMPEMRRRPSHAQNISRHDSNAKELQRRQSQADRLHRNTSRASNIEKYKGRRTPVAQNHRLSNVSQGAKLPTRRGSLKPIQEPPSGEKLWYSYLKEKPDYLSRDLAERNKRQGKVWSAEKREWQPRTNGVTQRESFGTPVRIYPQPPPPLTRSQSFSALHPQPHPQPPPNPYPHPPPFLQNPPPPIHWM